jgi:hypothetical protein
MQFQQITLRQNAAQICGDTAAEDDDEDETKPP